MKSILFGGTAILFITAAPVAAQTSAPAVAAPSAARADAAA